MNVYLVFGIFIFLTILIATLSKGSFKRSIVKEHSEAYFEKGWKQWGVRTNYYRVAIGLAAFITMAIVAIVKLVGNQI
ncbi:hypothetical protein [Daejeonella sp. H1SJ63]|uniref:hypothetical protein n=1 Tax=Daejeonella sp. H1SJ63 TaxID=3034145 RepID=UPI0023EC312F|nr:hypothetical protein [Daejeonella sp. H1SJ63]